MAVEHRTLEHCQSVACKPFDVLLRSPNGRQLKRQAVPKGVPVVGVVADLAHLPTGAKQLCEGTGIAALGGEP